MSIYDICFYTLQTKPIIQTGKKKGMGGHGRIYYQ